MIIVAGDLRIAPAHIEEARGLMQGVVYETNREPGCRTYAWSQDMVDPGVFRFFEIWESQAALDAHAATPHLRAFVTGMAPIQDTPRINIYQISGVQSVALTDSGVSVSELRIPD